jgi:NADP-dependent 3-hydroxy acid dehydrogenase YdfG
MFNLTGKTALVTGATGGIGGAVARALHAQGATVVLSGTREAVLADLAKELGERAYFATANLSDAESVDNLVSAAEDRRRRAAGHPGGQRRHHQGRPADADEGRGLPVRPDRQSGELFPPVARRDEGDDEASRSAGSSP